MRFSDANPRRSRLLGSTLLLGGLALLHATGLRAQETTGSVSGRVLDPEGRGLDGVTVRITSPSLLGRRIAVSGSAGRFRQGSLPVGSYTVLLERTGFRSLRVDRVAVRLGQTTSLGELRMEPRAVELEPLVVTAGDLPFDPVSTTVGVNLERELYSELPVDRDYRSVIELLPHANRSYLGDGVNIGGATGLENVFYIDGVNVTDPYRATSSTSLPYNFVEEVQVKEGGYEAEHGKALGGIVNVVTRSGGDAFEIDGFGFFTNDALATEAKRGLADARIDGFATYDFGASASGPILRDRLSFFAAYNPSFENRDVGLPGLGFQEDRLTRHQFAAKLDWRAGDRTDVEFSVLGDPTTRREVDTWGAFSLASPTGLRNPDPFLGRFESGGVNLAGKVHSEPGRSFLFDASVARSSRRENRFGETERGAEEPLFIDLTTGEWSGGYGLDESVSSTRTSGEISGTWTAGSHTVKAGASYEENRVRLDSRQTEPGLIQKLGPSNFRVLVATIDVDVRNRVPTAYVQDAWRATERWTLKAGLRWSGQFLVGAGDSVAQAIPDQLQPRVGFIYQPGELGSQKIFGHFGRYYLQLPLHLSTLGHITFDNRILVYSEDPRSPGATPERELVFASPDGTPVASNVPGLEGEHFDELVVGYERRITNHFRLSVRGIRRELREAIGFGVDPETGRFVAGNFGTEPMEFLPGAERNYTALELTLAGEGGGRLSFLASYVLSRNHGNYTGQFASEVGLARPANNFSLQLAEQAPNAEGLLPNDRPHVFKLSGAYRFPFGLSGGTFFTVQSGTPVDELGASSFFLRPLFLEPRGTAGRTPAIWDLDLRLTYSSRRGRLLGVPGRLVLDLRNVGSPRKAVLLDEFRFLSQDEDGRQTNPNPNFMEPVRFQDPMSVRLGFELGY